MKNMRPFEIGVLALFGGLIILALVIVSSIEGGGSEGEVSSPVTIWGTIPAQQFNTVLGELADAQESFELVSYRSVDERNFDDELVNAIAEGRGPDLIFVPHTKLADQLPKTFVVPYNNFPQRDFKQEYIDGAELYMLPSGVAGYPVAVDPLVMYWNRDILTSNGFATAPTTWEEIVNRTVPDIVRRDFSRNILLSPIAMGEYRNVKNAYAILSALMLQGGSRMVSASAQGQLFSINFDSSVSGIDNPATNALEFFTSFATINNPLYSWNRAQPEDINMFSSGDVAIYLGMGSEYDTIARLNPNLNFDVAELPQSANASAKRTYGNFYGFMLLNSASNFNGGFATMHAIARSPYYSARLAEEAGLTPIHRSTLETGTTDAIDQVLYTSALYVRGWYNPEFTATEEVFQEMVESVLGNRRKAAGAVGDAMVRLRELFR